MKKYLGIILSLIFSISLYSATGTNFTIITGNNLTFGVGGMSAGSTYGSFMMVGNFSGEPNFSSHLGGPGIIIKITIGGVGVFSLDNLAPNNVPMIIPSKNFSTGKMYVFWVAPSPDILVFSDGSTANYTPTSNLNYAIYRSATPDFSSYQVVAWNLTSQNAVAGVEVSLNSGTSLNFFQIKSVDGDSNASASSDVGVIFQLVLTPNTTVANELRLSLPYRSIYLTSTDIGKDLGPNGEIQRVQKKDYATQQLVNCVYNGGTWIGGTTFNIVPTEAYSVYISPNMTQVTLNIFGFNDPSIKLSVTGNPTGLSEYRINMPYNAFYRNSYDLAQYIDNSGTKVYTLEKKTTKGVSLADNPIGARQAQSLIDYNYGSSWPFSPVFYIKPGEVISLYIMNGATISEKTLSTISLNN